MLGRVDYCVCVTVELNFNSPTIGAHKTATIESGLETIKTIFFILLYDSLWIIHTFRGQLDRSPFTYLAVAIYDLHHARSPL
jgi:hypothetical protein